MALEDPLPFFIGDHWIQTPTTLQCSLSPSAVAASVKSSKICALTNLNTDVNANKEALNNEREANNNNGNLDDVAISSWRIKDSKKRDPITKWVQFNWVSNFDDSIDENLIINSNNNHTNNNNGETKENLSGNEDNDESIPSKVLI
ncbi:hypothetical protein V6N11_047267 [Hibiscus sabdariffa]|uniref:Uncharacterized protein n=2 Tax=Hibiscus sabdariffa TaxID=183260 RepID=A0ABR2BP14_9ROSI